MFVCRLALLILVFLSACLTGCDAVDVVSGVNQSQANQIVAALSQNGIMSVANKQVGAGGNFSVEVNKADYIQAVSLLSELKLPEDVRETFAEVVKSRGLLPELKAIEEVRLDRAIAAQVEDVVRALPGVVSVRAMLNSNHIKSDNLANRSSLLLIIQREPGANIVEADIKSMISPVVPGLVPDAVRVEIKERSPVAIRPAKEGLENVNGKLVYEPLVGFMRFFRVPACDYVRLRLFFAAVMALTAFVCGSLGFLIGYRYELIRGVNRKESLRRK